MASEKVNAQVLYGKDEDAKVTLLVMADNGVSNSLSVYKKSYIESSKKYVEDQETFDKALEKLHELGVSEENSINLKGEKVQDLTDAINELNGQTIEVYANDTSVSLNPIQEFIRFDNGKINPELFDELMTLFKQDVKLEGLPVTDYKGQRFNIGFKANINGQDYNFRVSQLRHDGKKLSLKYRTKSIEGFQDDLEKGKVPEAMVENAQKSLENMLENSRNRVKGEIFEALGKDVDEMIENEETVDLQLTEVTETNLTKEDGSPTYMMVAKVVSEPYQVEED